MRLIDLGFGGGKLRGVGSQARERGLRLIDLGFGGGKLHGIGSQAREHGLGLIDLGFGGGEFGRGGMRQRVVERRGCGFEYIRRLLQSQRLWQQTNIRIARATRAIIRRLRLIDRSFGAIDLRL